MSHAEIKKQWRSLRERRNAVQAKYIELNKFKSQRALDGDEQAKWVQVEAELTDLNARVSTLEDLMASDPGDDAAAASMQRDDGTGLLPDSMGTGARSMSGVTRNDDGTYTLPNGRRAVLVGDMAANGGQSRNLQNAPRIPGTEPDEFRNEELHKIRQKRAHRSTGKYRSGFASYLTGDRFATRASQQDVDTAGGYLIAPTQVADKIYKVVDNRVWLRQLATKFTVVNGQSLGAPTLDNNPADSDWTPEIGTIAEETAMNFGRRELRPNVNTKFIKVSDKMLRNGVASGFISGTNDSADENFSGIEGLITNRFGYKFAVSEEKAMLTGNGINQPLGLFTASARGISTGRDVVTGLATGLTYAGLLNIKYALKPGYDGSWLISQDFLRLAQGLVDSQSRPLFLDPMNLDQPALLMGRKFYVSYYVPNTFTTGLYVGMYADFSFYLIADGADFFMVRLDELFKLNNQTGFIGYREMDAMPAIEEAFVRIKTS
jgi:HK97 family phage major capsid protein